jgi:hypothetical protein
MLCSAAGAVSKTRQKAKWCKEGDIVSIELGDGSFAFARALEVPLKVFYTIRSATRVPIDQIVRQPVAFKIWAREKEGLQSGKWRIEGNIALSHEERQPVPFFKQDILDPTSIAIYMSNSHGEETPAAWEEIQGLESVAVWESHHVEDRLRDHFAGRQNKWGESLKPKKPKRPDAERIH